MVRGLVEQQEIGLLQEQLGQGKARALATAQVANFEIELLILKAQAVQCGVDAVVDGVAARQLHLPLQGFLPPQEGIQAVALGVGHLGEELIQAAVQIVQLAEGGFGLATQRLLGVEIGILGQVPYSGGSLLLEMPLIGCHESGDGPHEGGLAAAVAPHKADPLACFHGETDAVEDDARTKSVA